MNYKRSKFFTTLNKRKIKYLFLNKKSQITLVFFHGFMSDMIGAKPMAIQKFCRKQKLNFLKFEYSGHGRSSGKFIDGTISQWTNEAKQLINKFKKNKKLIFIGSSMGSWIGLNLISYFKMNLVGFVGIASAPDFTDELMWKKFPRNIKNEIDKKGILELKNEYGDYIITKKLIKDGRKNKVLKKIKKFKIPITLFHGNKDRMVPVKYSKKTLRLFKAKYKKLFIIKNGDHSLSRKSDLKKICKELNNMIFNHLILNSF